MADSYIERISADDLCKILEDHEKWLYADTEEGGGAEGRTGLSGVILSTTVLKGVDLPVGTRMTLTASNRRSPSLQVLLDPVIVYGDGDDAKVHFGICALSVANSCYFVS